MLPASRRARTLLACVIAGSSGYSQAAPQERIRSTTAAIVVDVVVRDEKGRPVTDLRRRDFEIYEDGVRQDLGDVTLVAPESLRGSAGSGEREQVRRPAEGGGTEASHGSAVSVVALVFDRLAPEGRAAAHKAALGYINTLQPGDVVGVFLSDLSLKTIQGFTSDRDALRGAVEKAGSSATAVFDRDAIRDPGKLKAAGDSHPSVPAVASAESPGRPAPRERGVAAREPLAAVTTRSEALWEEMARDQQGYATTHALLALSAGLGSLPGRKSIVLFAEGISIPPAVLPQFHNVVITANRHNVSIYTIDAAGLRVHSSDQATAREVRAIGDANLGAVTETDTGGRPLVATLERNEDVLRGDPRTSLTLLAQQTGGFLIDDTNDLLRGLRTIDIDRRFHYLLTYTPKNPNFTGEWRTVQVRVPTRRVTVRNRTGYLAVPATGTLPVLAHEGPALAALERAPAPRELPVRGGAFVFPSPAAPEARVAVLVAADGAALGRKGDAPKDAARTDFTILARLKDGTGEIVRKASQQYRLTSSTPGEVLFFRQPTLAPGAYVLEYVVHDALGGRAGTGTAPVMVPNGREGAPRVSSLLIVRRTERVPAGERSPANPLYYRDLLLYPNLGEPISKAQTPAVSFAFNIVPGAQPVRAALVLSQGGLALAQTPLPLGAPDANGLIWYSGQVPLATLPPAEYTLTLTITAEGHRAEQRATFRTIE